MKRLIILAMLVLAGCATKSRTTKWLDSQVTERWERIDERSWQTVRPSLYGQVSDPNVRIGLRADGVVVWKEVP